MKVSRKTVEINAGSMADIAFLLLVFFLVTTKIETDYGLHITLPEWQEDIEAEPFLERNVFEVNLNAANELMVEGERFERTQLKEQAKAHILNNGRVAKLSEKPTKAAFKFQISNGTDYATYLATLDQLEGAYLDIWEGEARKRFQKPYDQLVKKQRMAIREDYPRMVFEPKPE